MLTGAPLQAEFTFWVNTIFDCSEATEPTVTTDTGVVCFRDTMIDSLG
jgi:hypothetical protein